MENVYPLPIVYDGRSYSPEYGQCMDCGYALDAADLEFAEECGYDIDEGARISCERCTRDDWERSAAIEQGVWNGRW